MVSAFVEAKRKLGLDVVLSDKAAPPMMARLADQNAFVGVLDHVVTNAIEAAPRGSPVTVSVGTANGSIRVSVADDGPGMSQKFIADQLFRPLRTTKTNGFGIGAFQAREVMRDLGGNLDVRSKVGEGTTVALSLPVAASEIEAARV